MTGSTHGKYFSKIFLLATLFFAALFLSGCALFRPGGSGSNGNWSHVQNGFIPVINTYKYGLPYAPGRLNDDQLRAEYQDWVAHYVSNVSSSAACVRRDSTTGWDTVSEGIGYGMLLSVYFNDQATFTAIYNYMTAHTNSQGLMQWRVDQYGNNIDERGFYVNNAGQAPHPAIYTNGAVTTNSDGTVQQPSSTAGAAVTTVNNGYPTYVNSRGRTSATDADEDIALSLCMAAKEWGSAWNTDAVNYVTYLMNDFKPGWLYGDGDIYLTAGVYDNGPGSYGAWGGYTPEGTKAGFNPSYFTPAYYPIFNQVVPNALWSTLAQTMWQQFAIISGTANKTGLFPDWCDTSTGQCIQTILCSDFGAQSYNFYYDAVRVPWRMATAASWNNDLNGFTYAGEAANFFKTPFYGTTGIAQYGQNIVDGYFINGTGLVPSYEGITMYSPSTGWAVEGVDHNPPVFTAMIGASTLPYGDIYYANSFYSNIVANKTSYSSPYGHYFANTLRLLSLLYMSGEMINLYDAANTNSITTNIIPGLINAEDCVGTNGHNYLTNIGSENGLGTNNTSLAYDFYVNNTLSTYQYSVYNLTYRVESTIALYPPSYGPETPTQVYILVDGTIQGAVVVAGTSGAWMTFNSTCLLTPGVHRITVATTRYGLNFGSMQFSFLNGAVIQSISSAGTTIDFTKYSLKGAQINANSPVYLTTDCYDYPQQQVDYAIVMPGVPGTAASSHTLDFWYETYIQSSISSSMNSANTSFTTLANLPQNQALVHTNITVSLNPGLQDLRISGEGLILSNLIIH